MRIRRIWVIAAALVVALAVVVTLVVRALNPQISSPVTLVGTFQPALGCSEEWQDGCSATKLIKTPEGTFARDLRLPGGAFEYRVHVRSNGEKQYGLDGVQDGPAVPLVLGGPATVRVTYDPATHRVRLDPQEVQSPDDGALAEHSLRVPGSTEQFYFVMTDRFANGSTANDRGGRTGDRMATGYDPTDKGFYHGGDLRGLQSRLDYIQGLGTTAIWLTPSFVNRPVQGTGDDASAGYHGYWITDFTTIDPHLGTNAEMKALIDAAHARGMKVYFDIVVNHTADVISYEGGSSRYVSKAERPYQDAAGQPFDDVEAARTGRLPALDAATAAPYRPVFATQADRTVKKPAWLNEPTMYHNRGAADGAGESETYGDYAGLDDLWTERPEVLQGLTDIYRTWAELGVDGFRIDTAKHVNMDFWRSFAPAVQAHALQQPNGLKRPGVTAKEFFMFGEVYSPNAMTMAQYTTTGRLPATLDFAFQEKAVAWVQGGAATALGDLYADDDYYTDADSNAYASVTFLGNHDMGRVGMIVGATSPAPERLARSKLAHSLMFLTRGQPVVYYGDEQGFMGAAGDKDARQDMFATKVAQFAGEDVIGAPSGSRNRYDTKHPIYQHISQLSKLRAAHPVLATGAMGPATAANGSLAFTRWSPTAANEYLVVLNNTDKAVAEQVTVAGGARTWTAVAGASGSVQSDAAGAAAVSVPAHGFVVYSAPRGVSQPGAVTITEPPAGPLQANSWVAATWPDAINAEVTFRVRVVGSSEWTILGTDDTAPYRVRPNLDAYAPGTLLEVRAIGRDATGRLSAVSVYVTVRR